MVAVFPVLFFPDHFRGFPVISAAMSPYAVEARGLARRAKPPKVSLPRFARRLLSLSVTTEVAFIYPTSPPPACTHTGSQPDRQTYGWMDE